MAGGRNLVAEVDHQVVVAGLIPDQSPCLGFVVDKGRSHASLGSLLVADNVADALSRGEKGRALNRS